MDEVKWIVGVALTLLAVIGGYIMRDRMLMKTITESDNDIRKDLALLKDDVFNKIASVRTDYVRRDDLTAHLERTEATIDAIKRDIVYSNDKVERKLDELFKSFTDETKATNTRIDNVLMQLNASNRS